MSTKGSGFTLLELLVVIGILGILSAAGLLTYNGYIKSAKRNSAENITQQIALAQTEEYANSASYLATQTGNVNGDFTTASPCTASAASTTAIENGLFQGDNVIPDDIDFWVCILGNDSASDFIISAQEQAGLTLTGCRIDLKKNNTAKRTGC